MGRSREKELVLSKYTINGREYYYNCPGDELETCSGGDLAMWVRGIQQLWCLGRYDGL